MLVGVSVGVVVGVSVGVVVGVSVGVIVGVYVGVDVGVSVGVAVYPDDMPAAFDDVPAKVVIDEADQASYEAKRRGRDQAVSIGETKPRKPKLHEVRNADGQIVVDGDTPV